MEGEQTPSFYAKATTPARGRSSERAGGRQSPVPVQRVCVGIVGSLDFCPLSPLAIWLWEQSRLWGEGAGGSSSPVIIRRPRVSSRTQTLAVQSDRQWHPNPPHDGS